jgi:hypothetical protein
MKENPTLASVHYYLVMRRDAKLRELAELNKAIEAFERYMASVDIYDHIDLPPPPTPEERVSAPMKVNGAIHNAEMTPHVVSPSATPSAPPKTHVTAEPPIPLHTWADDDNIIISLIEERPDIKPKEIRQALPHRTLAAVHTRLSFLRREGKIPSKTAGGAEALAAPPDLSAAPASATVSPPKKRRGRPPKKSARAEEGEYPIIGRTIGGDPQFGSMRMKVIEEKVVDGHKVKVLPPGYAQGAYPQKNVTVRS